MYRFESDCKTGYKDKKSVICRLCKTCVKYSGNTTNLNGHLNRYYYSARYPDASLKSATNVQQTLISVLEKQEAHGACIAHLFLPPKLFKGFC